MHFKCSKLHDSIGTMLKQGTMYTQITNFVRKLCLVEKLNCEKKMSLVISPENYQTVSFSVTFYCSSNLGMLAYQMANMP